MFDRAVRRVAQSGPEALRAFEATGLVEVVPRRGAYVSQFESHAARQLLELRQPLETYATELAARNRTDADLATIRECIELGRQAAAASDVVAAAGHHRQFHRLIEQASKNLPFSKDLPTPVLR